MFLCPLINIGLGKIKDVPITDPFFSKKASQMRRKIGKHPECLRCTEPGLERYALLYEGFTYLRLLSKMEKRDFFQLHHHMGLDKYF